MFSASPGTGLSSGCEAAEAKPENSPGGKTVLEAQMGQGNVRPPLYFPRPSKAVASDHTTIFKQLLKPEVEGERTKQT